jgi:type II secretory pathway pseudopilin PulG
LIELLAGIAILAILVALIFSFTRNSLAKANQTKSLNNMRQVASGLTLYAADHDGQFPPRQMDGDSGSDRWPKLVFDYLGDTKIYAAPDDEENFIKRKLDPLSNGENNTSYIMNGGWDPGLGQDEVNQRPLRTMAIDQPSKTILVSAVFNDTNFYLDVSNGDHTNVLDPRLFGGKSNCYVFMDGSARTISAEEYKELNDAGGHPGYLWLINKDAQ